MYFYTCALIRVALSVVNDFYRAFVDITKIKVINLNADVSSQVNTFIVLLRVASIVFISDWWIVTYEFLRVIFLISTIR